MEECLHVLGLLCPELLEKGDVLQLSLGSQARRRQWESARQDFLAQFFLERELLRDLNPAEPSPFSPMSWSSG